MLGAWIASFILGVVVARTHAVVSLVMMAGYASLAALVFVVSAIEAWMAVRTRRAVRWPLVLGIAGMFWGLGHGAPFPTETVRGAVVVKTTTVDGVNGPAIVRGDAGVFEVSAPQRVSAAGTVTPRRFARLLGPTWGRFIAGRHDDDETGRELLHKLRDGARDQFKARVAALKPHMATWLAGIIMGEKHGLTRRVREAFRVTGVYHLLVVSGLHVTLIAHLLVSVIKTPAHLLYALRLISPTTWPQVLAVIHVTGAAMALLYLAISGSSVAAQRAALLFVVLQIFKVSPWPCPRRVRFQIGASLQILIFPIGFVSEASLLSWAAYLMVVNAARGEDRRPRTFGRGFARVGAFVQAMPSALRLQANLTLFVAACFGQLAVIGLVSNLLFIPLFPLVLTSGLLALLIPGSLPGELCLALQESFIQMIILFGDLCRFFPWLSIGPDALPRGVRLACLVFSSWAFLNTCRDLSITDADPGKLFGRRSGGSIHAEHVEHVEHGEAVVRKVSGDHR